MIAQPMNFQPVAFIGSSSYPLQEELCLRAKSWRAPLDRFQGIVDAHVAGYRSEGVGCDAGTACAVVAWVTPNRSNACGSISHSTCFCPMSCCTCAAV